MAIMHVCPTVPSHLRRSQLEPKSARSVQSGGPAPLALLHPPLRLGTAKGPRGGHPQRRQWGKAVISLSRRVFTSWRQQQCPSCVTGTRSFYCGACVTTAGEGAGCTRARLVVTVHSTHRSNCGGTAKSILVSETRGALAAAARERAAGAAFCTINTTGSWF
jgi:hypothetical protein